MVCGAVDSILWAVDRSAARQIAVGVTGRVALRAIPRITPEMTEGVIPRDVPGVTWSAARRGEQRETGIIFAGDTSVERRDVPCG